MAQTPFHLNGGLAQPLTRFLSEAGLAADAYSRTRLIEAMHRARMEWAAFQLRRAGGDYTPDPSAKRFPEWTPLEKPKVASKKGQSGGETLTSLFALWETQHRQAGKAARSIGDFKHKVDSLRAYLGHDDASRVTGRAADEWCDHLLERDDATRNHILNF